VVRRVSSHPANRIAGAEWEAIQRHLDRIALAGGNGKRLAAVTRDRHGQVVPKQYCSLLGARSLLGDALARAERLAEPASVSIVVAAEHERYWRTELRLRPERTVVVQPQNRGTAAGVLLPLLPIARRDPDAVVVLLPTDHFVEDEGALSATLREAMAAAWRDPQRVLLVGIRPDAPESDYGWILPGAGSGRCLPIERFVEKPSRQVACELLRSGGVWNSFLLVGAVSAFVQLYRRKLPELLAAFAALGRDRAPRQLQRLYATLPEADFSRDLLQGSESSLGLFIAPPCGWTDLGTPSRVASCVSALLGPRWAEVPPGCLAAAVRGPLRQLA
jgi:mannose-1-phosphate guanylyltransferase